MRKKLKGVMAVSLTAAAMGCWMSLNAQGWHGTIDEPQTRQLDPEECKGPGSGPGPCEGEPCVEGGPHPGDWKEWKCKESGKLTYAYFDPYRKAVAIGSPPGLPNAPISDLKDGTKIHYRDATFDCPTPNTKTDYESETASVSYSLSGVTWSPTPPGICDTAGSFTFTGSVYGVSSEPSVCPNTGTVTATFTLDVVKVSSLTASSPATLIKTEGEIDYYAAAYNESGGTVTITATPYVDASDADLSAIGWSLSGGSGGGLRTRTVSLSEPGEYSFKAKCGTSEKNIIVLVMDVVSIDVWDSNGRHAADGLLQVVPLVGGEDVYGLATISPNTDTLPDEFPAWSYAGSNQYGKSVSFAKGASAWTSNEKVLKNVSPNSSIINCESKSASIPIYPYNISSFTFADQQMHQYLTATLNVLLEFFGKEGNSIEDLRSEGSISNQWKEKSDNLATWVYFADYVHLAKVSAKIDVTKVTGIKALADWLKKQIIIKRFFKKLELAAYLATDSAINESFTFSKTVSGEFIVTPKDGVPSSVVYALGGEAAAVPKADIKFSIELKLEGNDTMKYNAVPWADDSGFGVNSSSNHTGLDMAYTLKLVVMGATIFNKKGSKHLFDGGNFDSKNITLYQF